MRKKLLTLGFILFFTSFSYAQEERLTITTYYPSPFGNYRELRARRVAIGDNYINRNNICWEDSTGTNCSGVSLNNTILYGLNLDLAVEGNVLIGPKPDLQTPYTPYAALQIMSRRTPSNDQTLYLQATDPMDDIATHTNNCPGITFLNSGGGGVANMGFVGEPGAWAKYSNPGDLVVGSFGGNLILGTHPFDSIDPRDGSAVDNILPRIYIRNSSFGEIGGVGVGTAYPTNMFNVYGPNRAGAISISGGDRGNDGYNYSALLFQDDRVNVATPDPAHGNLWAIAYRKLLSEYDPANPTSRTYTLTFDRWDPDSATKRVVMILYPNGNVSVNGTLKSTTQSNYYGVPIAQLTAQQSGCTAGNITTGWWLVCQSACSRWCRDPNPFPIGGGGYSGGTLTEYGAGTAGCVCIP